MEVNLIRQKLHLFIDTIGDEKAAAIYSIFEEEIDSDAQRKKLVHAERLKYLQGIGQSFSPAEVKEMALNKQKRDAL